MITLELCQHILSICTVYGNGQQIYDYTGEIWRLMEFRHPEKVHQVALFESRYDSSGILCPWYVLHSGESGPIFLHALALDRLTNSKMRAKEFNESISQ